MPRPEYIRFSPRSLPAVALCWALVMWAVLWLAGETAQAHPTRSVTQGKLKQVQHREYRLRRQLRQLRAVQASIAGERDQLFRERQQASRERDEAQRVLGANLFDRLHTVGGWGRSDLIAPFIFEPLRQTWPCGAEIVEADSALTLRLRLTGGVCKAVPAA